MPTDKHVTGGQAMEDNERNSEGVDVRVDPKKIADGAVAKDHSSIKKLEADTEPFAGDGEKLVAVAEGKAPVDPNNMAPTVKTDGMPAFDADDKSASSVEPVKFPEVDKGIAHPKHFDDFGNEIAKINSKADQEESSFQTGSNPSTGENLTGVDKYSEGDGMSTGNDAEDDNIYRMLMQPEPPKESKSPPITKKNNGDSDISEREGGGKVDKGATYDNSATSWDTENPAFRSTGDTNAPAATDGMGKNYYNNLPQGSGRHMKPLMRSGGGQGGARHVDTTVGGQYRKPTDQGGAKWSHAFGQDKDDADAFTGPKTAAKVAEPKVDGTETQESDTFTDQNLYATLRPSYGIAGPGDIIPSKDEQLRSDIEFDMFSVVQPGFGEGVDNKLFLYEEARRKYIIEGGDMFSPGQWLGPTNTLQPLPWQWQNVKAKGDIDHYQSRVLQRQRNAMGAVRAFGAGSVSAMGYDHPQVVSETSSSGMPRPKESVLEPQIENRCAWIPDRDPAGYILNRRGFKRLFSPWRSPYGRETQNDNGGPHLRKRRALAEIHP